MVIIGTSEEKSVHVEEEEESARYLHDILDTFLEIVLQLQTGVLLFVKFLLELNDTRHVYCAHLSHVSQKRSYHVYLPD